MQRRTLVRLFAAGISLVIIGFGYAFYFSSPSQFNVILVTLDTTRADRIGCYGYGGARTPALDALAKQGVLFERAYAPVPMTLPSHASILTGLYPPEHGLRVNGRGRLGGGIPVLAECLRARNYDTGAFLASFVLNAKFGLNRGFQVYDDDLAGTESSDRSVHRRRDGQAVLDAALAWLQARRSRPFFCWVHLYDPHFPYRPRQENFGIAFQEQPYDAGVAYVDLQVQRLRKFLENRKLADRTLIVVVGDHGEGLLEHAEVEHGYQLYETTLRVPLIIVPPRPLKPGHRVPTPVSLVDVMPTILEALGVPQPDGASGRTLQSGLAGLPVEPRPCYAEADAPLMDNRWAPLRGVVAGRWKCIQTTRPELYDLEQDPQELHNLAETESDRLRELTATLNGLQQKMVQREAGNVNLTSEERRILESLGYAGGKGATATAPGDKPLPDIKDMMPHYNSFVDAKHLLGQGAIEAAVAKIREIVEQAPHYLAARVLLGDTLMRQRELVDATKIYESVLADQPDRADAHAHLGTALAAQGSFPEAIAHYRAALEIDSEAAQWHYNLARALLHVGKSDESLTEFEEAIRCDPGFVDALLNLGKLLTQNGRPADAITHYQTALKFHPRLAAAHLNWGIALASEKRFSEAVAQASKAVELEPQNFDARFNLGMILFDQRRYQDAISQFEAALRLRPDDPAAREQLQRAKTAQGS